MHSQTLLEWDAGDVGQDFSVPYCDIYFDGGNVIVANVNDRILEGRDNAARLVACWNFFHGRDIPTERIPEGGFWEMVNVIMELREAAAPEYDLGGLDAANALLAKLGVEP